MTSEGRIPIFWKDEDVKASVAGEYRSPFSFGNSQKQHEIPTLDTISKLTVLDLGIGPGLGNPNYMHISPIRVLIGIEIAENLISFSANGYGITDLSRLATLVGLERLELQSNQIEDLSPLLLLPNLKYLDIKYNPLSSVSKRAHLPSLRSRVDYIDA